MLRPPWKFSFSRKNYFNGLRRARRTVPAVDLELVIPEKLGIASESVQGLDLQLA